jgi:hypothetical protein
MHKKILEHGALVQIVQTVASKSKPQQHKHRIDESSCWFSATPLEETAMGKGNFRITNNIRLHAHKLKEEFSDCLLLVALREALGGRHSLLRAAWH